jgi:hypothetical protein
MSMCYANTCPYFITYTQAYIFLIFSLAGNQELSDCALLVQEVGSHPPPSPSHPHPSPVCSGRRLRPPHHPGCLHGACHPPYSHPPANTGGHIALNASR